MVQQTVGVHSIYYPSANAQLWFSTFVTLMQQITTYLDNVDITKLSQINDSNGNELLKFTTTTSAVNYLKLTNAATSTSVLLEATGDDTNINLSIQPKGSGKVVLGPLYFPNSDGTENQVMATDGSGVLSFVTRLANVVEDTSPQLGGNLDLMAYSVVSSGTSSIRLTSVADINLKLGDAAGANKVNIRDSSNAVVAYINSDGDGDFEDITANSLTLTVPLDGGSVDIAGATTAVAIADADYLPIYDVSASANRKITRGNILASLNSEEFLSSTSASASATIDITLSGSYDTYIVRGSLVIPVTDATVLWCRLQTAGGGFRSGASDYKWIYRGRSSAGSSTDANSNSDSEVQVNGTLTAGNAAGEFMFFELRISSPHNASYKTALSGDCTMADSAAVAQGGEIHAHVQTAEDNDAIQFLMSSGNISSGTFELYGIV